MPDVPPRVQGAAALLKAPFDELKQDYESLQAGRASLLVEVRVERGRFLEARQAEESFSERKEYLRMLGLGAEETTAVFDGLTEGKRFYEVSPAPAAIPHRTNAKVGAQR